jgi:hypothetical protein
MVRVIAVTTLLPEECSVADLPTKRVPMANTQAERTCFVSIVAERGEHLLVKRQLRQYYERKSLMLMGKTCRSLLLFLNPVRVKFYSHKTTRFCAFEKFVMETIYSRSAYVILSYSTTSNLIWL